MFSIFTGNDRPSLKDLYNHVVPDAAQKWKDLGVQLLRPDQENILNIIEMDNNDSTSRCKCVLEKWLETATDATWDCLIEALESPNIRLDYMANQLKQRMIIQSKKILSLPYLFLGEGRLLMIPLTVLAVYKL